MNRQNFEAVIIGSGAGGGSCAWALSKHGIRVLLLEAGQAYDPARDYLLYKPQWEQTGFPYKASGEVRNTFGPMQKLEQRWRGLRSWNHITGLMNSSEYRKPWKYHHVQGLGGSTLHFSGEAHRIHPESLKMKSRFGVAADWPIDYAELEPYYNNAEKLIGVAGPKGDSIRIRSQPYPLDPHCLSYASKKIREGCRKLGLSWVANPVAILSKPYDKRLFCNYCANCNRGCPRSDKGSVDVTFIKKAAASGNCTIKTGCRVTRINAGNNDKIKDIHFIDEYGNDSVVNCRVVIVACGAIETPRLLLLSKNKYAPEGLANESGHVGRNFMETLFWTSSGIFPESLNSYRGIPSDSICWDFNAPDSIPGIIGGCRFSPTTAEADLIGPINYARRVVGGWGHNHKTAMRKVFGRVLSVGAIGESLPNPDSYVDLDPEMMDSSGNPVSRIHSLVKDGELKRLEFMSKKTREILYASGVEKIFEEYGSYDIFSSTHVFGTCRMGSSPEESVVDKYCRSHRWRNMFIVDASVFPSSGGGESPSLTIEALAIRTAEHISYLSSRQEI